MATAIACRGEAFGQKILGKSDKLLPECFPPAQNVISVKVDYLTDSLGPVFKPKDPPQLLTKAPALKRGENSVKVPLFNSDARGF